MVDDVAQLVSVWSKATELAVKFLDEDKAVLIVRNAGLNSLTLFKILRVV